MTICPIALAVGCKKCPAFKFCPLTTVLGDQEEYDDEVESLNRSRGENIRAADEHLDKIEDKYQKYAEEELETNKNEEVIPEKKKPRGAFYGKLTKDERLALIKESAEKKSAHDNESW